jgi:RAD51-like protein 2
MLTSTSSISSTHLSLLTLPSTLTSRTTIPLTSPFNSDDFFIDETVGLKELTEVWGPSACGKTHIAMQLCLNVQTPVELGGLGGEAVFVDTNGDFMTDRLEEMAKWFRAKLSKQGSKLTEKALMEGIKYVRMLNDKDLIEFLFSFEKMLRGNRKIKLVAIDDMTLFSKSSDQQHSDKSKVLNNSLIMFLKMAKKYDVAIVLINTLKSAKRIEDKGTRLEPRHGEVLFQSVTNRVSIDRDLKLGDDIFKAQLTKGSIFYQRNGAFDMHFQVKESGISSKID